MALFDGSSPQDTGEVKERLLGRLPHNYLGSGSTLAASISANIAHGFDSITAVDKAQRYT